MKVPLGNSKTIKVDERRLNDANNAKTFTAFTQRIVTAVFSYNEVIGATLNGKKGKGGKRKLDDPLNGKMLCPDKVARFVGKSKRFQELLKIRSYKCTFFRCRHVCS